MSLNFRYIDYGLKFQNIYSGKKYKQEDYLYIFSDNRMRDIFAKRMSEKIFESTPTLITLGELKERIFYTDKTILKEAKRILAFFKCIPQNIKEELNITTYYDMIDLANNFFAYYRELIINEVTELEEYPLWQKRYLEYFSVLKEAFDQLCEKYNYLPSDWLEREENYNDLWLTPFSKIIFVDIVEFPKVYVNIIKKLSKEKEIEIALQMNIGDFDEEHLKLKKVSIPKLLNPMSIYTFKDEIDEALSLIYLKENQKYEVYSPAPEKNSFSKILPNYFVPSQNFTMNDTKLYKFLNLQLDLLINEEEKLGKTYPLSKFLSSFEDKVFKSYYNISDEDFKLLNSCAIEGYKYISKKILQEEWFEKNLPLDFLDKVNEILYDLDSINSISNTNELYIFFKEHIKIERFIEDNLDNVDILDKFFEIFGIIKSNEVMKIHSNFNEYFGNKMGISLYRLLIQYMKDLSIKSNIKYEQNITLIKGMDFVRHSEELKDINYFIDITDEFLPKNLNDSLILIEKQRKELGITTKEERREIERYRFFQALFSGKESVIFTKKDEDKGIEFSPFLEEIILQYSLPILPAPINNINSKNMIRNALLGANLGYIESSDEIFKKEVSDFKENKLQLGAYDYDKLMECPLNFYFLNIEKLTHTLKFNDKDISSRILGIIVHKVLEEFVNSKWKEILQDGIKEVEYEEILARMERAFRKERAKIPLHMDNYCQDIMIPIISRNIVKFFKELALIYTGIKIKRFQSEKSSFEKTPFYSGDIDIYLKGRADLVIESEIGNEIIDYKTGNKKDGQLDYYSIILYGESGQARKMVFNAWKGKIEKEEKVTLTREELEENLKSFVESTEYKRTEKKGTCSSCEYHIICGRGRN